MSDRITPRWRLKQLQDDIAKYGWSSAMWQQDDQWQFFASTDHAWIREQVTGRPLNVPIEAVREVQGEQATEREG